MAVYVSKFENDAVKTKMLEWYDNLQHDGQM
jgi:hypothetical protein